MTRPDDPGCETKVSFLPLNVTKEEQHVNSANNTSNDKDLKQPDDIYCGYGSCRPAFAQRFGTITWFAAACSASTLVTWTLNSYMNSQITSLEKHFNINSSTSGFLLSCNDLGFLVTTLVFSYYTRRLHIPRSLGYTTILFGAAGLLCTVAFLGTRDRIPSPPKESLDVTEDLNTHLIQMCSNQTLPSQDMDICEETLTTTRTTFQISDTWRKLAIFILALSMILQGMAKAPRTPFTTTYIDDNVPRTQTALYLGIITAVGVAGSSISFALGGVFSSYYVTLEETSISQRDPRWIGAWWIGFLLFGSLGIVAGIPLLFFPKRLRVQANLKVAMEARQKQLTTRTRIFRDVTDFMGSLRRILTNPVFMCLIIGSGLNLMGNGGIGAFLPKYLETQFSVSALRANLAVGINNLISFSILAPLSGYVISRFKFSPVTCLKVLVGCLIIVIAILSLGFVLGCRQPVIHTGVATDSHGVQNISRCVHTCTCDSQNFLPVCGGDGRNYFSPCHAGCTSMDQMGFSNCSCLASSESTIATGGLCVPDCNNFYPYMAVIFGIFAFSSFACIPAFMATMRSVGEVDKPISIGVNILVNSLLGWFPAPMVFGSMIDKTCLSWKQSCTSVGACSLYDIELFRFRFHMMVIGLISITIILYSTALTIAVCSKREVFQPNTDEYFVTRKEAKDQLTIALDESLSTSTRSRIRK